MPPTPRPTRVMAFTGTRADFGILRPVLQRIGDEPTLDLALVVGGSHFSTTYGLTNKEISDAGIETRWRIESDVTSDTGPDIARSTAATTASVVEAIESIEPDLALVLGDRYEALAFATACLLCRIPLGHIHGGETTHGAVDDAIRNAITQMSCMHLVAAKPFADKVRQMGAPTSSVAVVGAPGLDAIAETVAELDDPRSLVEELVGPLPNKGPLLLVSYHPETRSNEDPGGVMKSLLRELLSIDESTLLLSAPNADWGRDAVMAAIDDARQESPSRVRYVASFGHRAYIAAMLTADVIVGNSSSGIIEAPFVGLPTVNVGERQRGRPLAESVFSARSTSDVPEAVAAALQSGRAAPGGGLYGDGAASRRIVEHLLEYSPS